ncbi:MAG: DUF3048 domain-containing protein [Chloroflexota bacterium]|jgi:hypothetical protein
MCVPVPPESPDQKSRPMRVQARYALPATIIVMAIAILALNSVSSCTSPATTAPTPSPAAAVDPAVPPTARLSLQSQPAGAIVTVDGAERGKTPLVLESLEAGRHNLKLTMFERQDWQQEVVLAPNESKSLEIKLTPIPKPTPTSTPTPRWEDPIYPVAVMVENHVASRPQSGLSKADIVYEALVEGGISRFLAIYIDSKAELIGPVRSARHYYVYIADEFGAAYVNIGWSPQAYNALQATGLVNLDEARGDPGIWRSSDRYAPHNAYTSTNLLRTTLEQYRDQKPGSLAGFQFSRDPKPLKGEKAEKITIIYADDYFVEYNYDSKSKQYLRSMDGVPHKDAETGDPVSPRNVIVQYMSAWVIDDMGRLDMAQVGEGEALFFRDGVVVEGSWSKASYYDVTRWFDSDGKPVEFPIDKTWVQVVPPGNRVTY